MHKEDHRLFEDFNPGVREPRDSKLAEQVSVRAASIRDAEAIGRISADREGCDPQPHIEAVKRSLERDTLGRSYLVLVAEVDGQVVGYGKARHLESTDPTDRFGHPRGWYLTGVVVDPSFRRRGIGERLTSERLRWIAERSSCVYYFANAQNRISIALHDRFGFVEIARAPRFGDTTFVGGEGVLFKAEFGGSGR